MRHSREIGGDDAAVDVLAHGDRHLRLRSHELLRLDVLAQPDDFALAVRHLNADRALAGHALDQNALGFQREAKIVAEIGDAAVLDPGFGLELERRDDRSRIDLRDLSVNLELGVLLGEHLRQQLEFVGVDLLLLVGTLQQAARRQLVSAGDARHRGLGFVAAVGALGDFRIGGRFRDAVRGQRLGQNSAGRGRGLRRVLFAIMRSMPVRRGSDGNLRLRGPRRDQLRLHDRLRNPPLLQFLLLTLLGALLLPIFVAIPQRGDEGEPRRSPQLNRRERERRREIQRDRQHRGADDVGADQIQIVNQKSPTTRPSRPSIGNHVHPAQVSGQQRQHGGNEHHQPDSAEALRQRRLHFHRAEPAHAEHRREDHQQECADAEELQHHVGGECADHADPVARGVRTGQNRGAVPRRIERRIRNEGEEKEERGDAHQEADQLIEPPVPGGNKNACQIIHVGQIPHRRHDISSVPQSARALTLCQEAGDPTMQENGCSIQLASRPNPVPEAGFGRTRDLLKMPDDRPAQSRRCRARCGRR